MCVSKEVFVCVSRLNQECCGLGWYRTLLPRRLGDRARCSSPCRGGERRQSWEALFYSLEAFRVFSVLGVKGVEGHVEAPSAWSYRAALCGTRVLAVRGGDLLSSERKSLFLGKFSSPFLSCGLSKFIFFNISLFSTLCPFVTGFLRLLLIYMFINRAYSAA